MNFRRSSWLNPQLMSKLGYSAEGNYISSLEFDPEGNFRPNLAVKLVAFLNATPEEDVNKDELLKFLNSIEKIREI